MCSVVGIAAMFLPHAFGILRAGFSEFVRGSELLGHREFPCSLLLNIAKLSSQVIIPVYIPAAVEDFCFPTPSPIYMIRL